MASLPSQLIYTDTGEPVAVGDIIRLDEMLANSTPRYARVEYFRFPSSPASSGKVTVSEPPGGQQFEYYTGVIGAEWINRTDR